MSEPSVRNKLKLSFDGGDCGSKQRKLDYNGAYGEIDDVYIW
jgi:hypothetical protein